MKKRVVEMLCLAWKQNQKPFYQGLSAQVAFFFILSVVPTLILLTQFLGMLNLSLDSVTAWMKVSLDSPATALITYIFNVKTPEAGSNFFLIIMAVWAASRIQFTLMRVTNYTYSGGHDMGNFWKDRLRSMVTIVITVVAIVAVIIVAVYGQVVVRFLANKLLISRTYDEVWTFFRWPIAGGLYFLIVSFNYFVLQSKGRKYRDIIPGSIFASIGMLLVTIVYSAYTTLAVDDNLIYGSMASIAVLMFWFYFMSMVLVMGILFNKVWMDTRPINNEK